MVKFLLSLGKKRKVVQCRSHFWGQHVQAITGTKLQGVFHRAVCCHWSPIETLESEESTEMLPGMKAIAQASCRLCGLLIQDWKGGDAHRESIDTDLFCEIRDGIRRNVTSINDHDCNRLGMWIHEIVASAKKSRAGLLYW